MQTLRNAHLLARFVLVWFALFIGVAIASPLVNPKAISLICTSLGVMKIQAQGDDGAQDLSAHTLDCPLCALSGAPPPFLQAAPAPVQPLAYVLQSIPSAIIAALTAAPPPARGPPALS